MGRGNAVGYRSDYRTGTAATTSEYNGEEAVKILLRLEDDDAGKQINLILKKYLEPHQWRMVSIEPWANFGARRITFQIEQILTPKEQNRLQREDARQNLARNFPEDFLDFDMTVKPLASRVLKRRRK